MDAWQDEDHEPLVMAMVADLRHDLFTRIDGADAAGLELWSRHGFVPFRTEIEYVFSPDPGRTGLADRLVPPGISLLAADEVEETALRELDDALRVDVPGSEGWVNDPDEFHDITFDERYYDPASYLVAADEGRRRFAGLVRITRIGERARLGLVAVAREYRRRNVAAAMLAVALRPVHERGVREVLAEADETNVPGNALLRRIGATRTGSSVVLRREFD